ncbi:GMC family oxidoreductase N-terminal domain-containing protein [Actinoplanes oblitus]|uniref:GMC family oxidoreductase N-terminal domain-containing protein n=1 Tax=Actinoplanes oblitus TaxID=3040509 RepID=A0ABY8W8Q9_9ACTN|nr:GMC family oxidoreductase N-terminal domain-containing protein [Actinoplanes oblitus]WIM92818.1 GMC family oxidoreductase N-terminal domain-containing protein [Actinoplanes oblitus]
MSDSYADYVVVGAGSAGCAVASRLSERGDRSVLLLEAGGWDTREEIHRVDLPSTTALWTADWAPTIDWGYRTEPEAALAGRRIPVARGRVVGGCSSINALMWVVGHPSDYDGWAADGCPGWSYEEVLPVLRRAEDYAGGDPRYRGTGGPIQVRRHDRLTGVSEAFVAATQELGYQPERDYNAGDQTGFGFHYQVTRDAAGRRSSAATGYLHPVLNRPNLTVQVGAQVTRMVVTGGRVSAVEYVRHGRPARVEVGGEVVLSAGAFETPKLLMLSGIGPAGHLAGHGIRCLVDLPEVGRNLQDHLFVPVCFQSRREHPPAELVSEAGLFVRTPAADRSGAPDLQFAFGSAKFLADGAPAGLWEGPGFTFAPVGLKPTSRGTVELAGTDPAVPATVRANYLSTDHDRQVLVEGVRLARELANTAAFADFRGPELGPGPEVTAAADLRDFLARAATTLWHPVGTCRMGGPDESVVDPRLRVHGVRGLRVADASVMPSIVAGNTNAATIMIGERAAEFIRQESVGYLQEVAR